MKLVLGFTQINYNFGHKFVSLELLTIHRNLINCLVEVVAHLTLGKFYVVLPTLRHRPCFGVANVNSLIGLIIALGVDPCCLLLTVQAPF